MVQNSVNLYCCHYLEGLLYFTLTPEEHCTGVVNSTLMSIYAHKELCTWVVSPVLNKCILGFIKPWFTDLSRLMIITGKVILIIMFWFIMLLFKSLEHLLLCLDINLRLMSYAGVDTAYVTSPFLCVGIAPSNVCQEFDTCLVEKGKHMNVPIMEHDGCSGIISIFFWLQCYCSDAKSGVRDLTKLDFLSLTLAFCYYSSDSSFFFWMRSSHYW